MMTIELVLQGEKLLKGLVEIVESLVRLKHQRCRQAEITAAHVYDLVDGLPVGLQGRQGCGIELLLCLRYPA